MEDIFHTERSLYGKTAFERQVYFEDTYCRELPPYAHYVTGQFQILGRNNDQELSYESQISNNLHTPDNSFSGSSGADSPEPPEYQSFPESELLDLADITDAACQENLKSSDVLDFEAGNIEIQDNNTSDRGTATGTWISQHGVSNNREGTVAGQIEPMKRIRRLRANDRERRRMRSLNRALESLKKCIPVPKSKRRVTKLEILRIACNYIRSLSDTLKGENSGSAGLRKRSRGDAVVNGFSIAQRLEILSGSAPRV